MALAPFVRDAWLNFLRHSENRGHAERIIYGDDIDYHVSHCLESAKATVQRIKADIGTVDVSTILEIGSSTGLNCLALQEAFPRSNVIGIEPEIDAVQVAAMMVQNRKKRPLFINGVGENIPLKSRSIDLILCHTVIEHVYDVEKVISEMSRVLSLKGIIHLEAPNYLWPREPHLDIWCFPLMGKPHVRFCAKLQGKRDKINFLEHLRFVHPRMLEKLFIDNDLVWENRVRSKIQKVISGEAGVVRGYHRLGKMLQILGKLGAAKIVTESVILSGLYPSVLYTLKHNNGQTE